jgi:hypothetical protein
MLSLSPYFTYVHLRNYPSLTHHFTSLHFTSLPLPSHFTSFRFTAFNCFFILISTTLSFRLIYYFPNPFPKITRFTGGRPKSVCR